MNVGRVFREEGERREAAALITRTTPPRPSSAMFETWWTLLGSLCFVLGGGPEEQGLACHLWMWRWMWALPPCSEARKAAFTLGHAALLIERWCTCISEVPFRPDDGFPVCLGYMVGHDDGKTTLQTTADAARALPEAQAIGQRAEALLRIAAWHIDDARGEAHARALGHEPTIPPHERVYTTDADAYDRYGGLWCSGATDGSLAQAILVDHFAIRSNVGIRLWGDAEMTAFAETAVASLPNGPWVMTSQDVGRFLDMILEDA